MQPHFRNIRLPAARGGAWRGREYHAVPVAVLAALASLLLTLAIGGGVDSARAADGAAPLPDYGAVVASPIRTDEDRAMDGRRKPLELLQFAQVRPGMNVLDISAGNGYTTQLLALAVGADGNVWAQAQKMRSGFEKRLAAHPQANVHPLVRGFEDPYPAEAPRLDLIVFILNYHDVANEAVDRMAMDKQLFKALRPGGHLVVVDHSAKPGSGVRDTKTLHRIDEAVVVEELQRAGFQVEARADFLRNPADPRDQGFFDMTMPTDRFALRLVRP